jgi:HEPN domain-containing protein
MPPKDSLYPQDWVRVADRDFKRAEQLLHLQDPEGAGYHLQQAVEKYVKAFLLFHGWKLKRIHDVEVLLNEALKFDATLGQFRSLCQRITGYYLIDRYPMSPTVTLTEAEVRDSLDESKKFIQRLKMAVK